MKPGRLAWILAMLLWLGVTGAGCGGGVGQGSSAVLADTSFLADIVRNVAGERLTVASLVPEGADPHSFEPTPQDAKRVAECRAIVINAAGLVPAIDDLIAGAGADDLLVIDASSGLVGLPDDPHFWLDPVGVIRYVENIGAGLTSIDPAGAEVYSANAETYTATLRDLDAWIAAQVEAIPPDHRLLVTNHESFGYFAARYGFEIVGTIVPTTSGMSSPSAQRLAALVRDIRATGAPAIFLETGSQPDLARQIASEAGVRLVTDLYTNTLGEEASTYVEMMRWNVSRIVEALR